MEFLQPVMFWGAWAVVIPVIIHFWYQKRGKTIAWAATQWLTDKTSLQHRGLRLDEIPLMLLRCLLVLLFVWLLAGPFLTGWKANGAMSRVHLVEANAQLVSNFRFELDRARKAGEQVFWLGNPQEEVKELSTLPTIGAARLFLQHDLDALGKTGVEVNLYLSNNQKLAALPTVYISSPFKLHSVADSSRSPRTPYLAVGAGKRLFVDKTSGRLKIMDGARDEPGIRFEAQPAHAGKIKVLLHYEDTAEQQTVRAALLALGEVYSMPLTIDTERNSETRYDWVLTDRSVNEPDPKVLYIVSHASPGLFENVVALSDSLKLSTSELVQNGYLPEWLGERMLDHYQLRQTANPLSQQQLMALFVPVKITGDQKSDKLYSWLLLCFVLTLMLERWLALRKTVSHNYG